ncbi:MAG: hypothetical protein GQ553_03925 [Nitrosomonadaceae bacterium]|nr:hypothetical protein [Nitrosomonadaceae bacterium]
MNGPVGITEAAKKAGLTPAGTRKAMETLERLGVASRVGTGRAQKFAPKEGNPYLSLFRELFTLEQRQHEELLRELRDAVGIPEIRDAWLRDLSTEPSHPLELGVVTEARSISWIGPELRVRLASLEKRFNLLIELNVFTRADSPEIPNDAVMLWGLGAGADVDRPSGVQTHAESAERSLRMARAIAELLKSDPSLIRRAIHYTCRLLHEGQGTANSDIGEWRQLLETYSPERLRELLVSKSSRAERLRRSSPFFAVLTPDERDLMLKLMEARR